MAHQTNHYLTPSSRERSWGIYVTGVGHVVIEPHDAYPPPPQPVGYDFKWGRGRILEDYALVYLVKGTGIFESRHQTRLEVRAGDCLILFPGEWHRYKPDTSIGWEEYWVAFHGSLVESWEKEEFVHPGTPILSLGTENSPSLLFEDLLQLTAPNFRSKPLESAALCHLLVAQLLSNREKSDKYETTAERLRAAGNFLRLHPDSDVDLPHLAKRFGMSYSSFRRSFTNHFGESPDRFRQIARIARAKQFLIETELPLKEIAARLRFSNEFYLMQVFKRHTGLTLTQWRSRRGARPL
jgi:AraC-like DNA-binding protein